MKNHQPQTFLPEGHDVEIFQTLQENSGTIEIRCQEVDAIRGESNHGTTKGPTEMQDWVTRRSPKTT